jgi:hypothetical protein
MKEDIKAKFVAALESGEYPQTKCFLSASTGGTRRFCAMGVLCDVVAPDAWSLWADDGVWQHGGNLLTTPDYVLEAAGLDRSDASILSSMNDTGSSLGAIAQYVRENL